ncbi:MAG TPA: carboxypeptidase-like regulatory domain-containing protein [Acidobacteriaceae bacterium]|nr:carboxypeptidase-like regulatory domain-containing protein [Acidobacteriaceae bacterium]
MVFSGSPVPGAVVTASQGSRKFVAISDGDGVCSFPDLPDGMWTFRVAMTGFQPVTEKVSITPNAPPALWQLQLLPLSRIHAQIRVAALPPAPAAQATETQVKAASSLRLSEGESNEELEERAMNGLLINGSVNNAATSSFAQIPAFGNNRRAGHWQYNGGLGVIFDNSALDARPYSLTGLNTPKPAYSNGTAVATLGGPLRIPGLLPRGPDFFVGYQWTRDNDATTESGRVPDVLERSGDFSQTLNASGQPVEIFNPATGMPFAGNVIPRGDISAQAAALLGLYPLPNFSGGTGYNYQTSVVSDAHQDALQLRLNQSLGIRNQLFGGFALQSARSGNPNLFGFLDTTDLLGIDTGLHWWHRLSDRLFLNAGYEFSRQRTRLTPFFENRIDVSGNAGISGNNQEPTNWGPPTLAFSSGVVGLTDAQSLFDRNETNAWSASILWARGRHNVTFGGDFRRQEFNDLSQEDPRGTFTFTGAATQGTVNGTAAGGSDLADFLLGIPDTSSIAFGNADKYFRQSVYDAYNSDDWRARPGLTVNAGIRWEYGAPITELFGRLVNLDITRGFRAAAPVVAGDPVGSLTGMKYPSSLIEPDKTGFEPRLGIAWRPLAGSSLVVRAGYGIYDDTSVYQTIATQMAQQAPLSKSLSVENSAACPLTLADGFNTCPATSEDTYAIDPKFRVGYAQNWDLGLQKDLSGSLQIAATYLGTKGTRGGQEFLPNTYPIGATNPCPGCPIGFAYLTSNGNSTREAGGIQLRRRLHNGLAATLDYTYSKAIDDDAMPGGQGASAASNNTAPTNSPGHGSASAGGEAQGSPAIAQNWLDPGAERGLSTFDQRHVLQAELQYTTGMGLGGGTLLSGWRGRLFKEWSFLTAITAASGTPQTPVYLAAVPGTGVTGTIRPDVTGAPTYAAPRGYFLNSAAYAASPLGHWGDARRDSITGPSEFGLDASVGRTFRLRDRYNLNVRIDSTNLLNHVTYANWNTTVTSPQFGLPSAANAMRSLKLTVRVRY